MADRDIGGDAEIDRVRLVVQGSNPTTPAASHGLLYVKADGVYYKDEAGVVTGPFTDSAGSTDTNALHDNVGGEIAAITGKTTPVDADVTVIEDSAATNAKKKLSWANLKATIKTYLDTIYAPIAKGVTNGDSHDHNGGDGATIAYSTLSGTPSTFAPSGHHTSHESGGGDAIKLDDLTAADDNTDLNVSTSHHGLTPKLPNDATKYLDGTGAYTVPAGGGGGGGGVTYGQVLSYPTTFSGDVQNGNDLNTNCTVVSAFSTQDVLNSRVLHLQTLGASKDHRIRYTLGTTKAGAFDVVCACSLAGLYWSGASDSYLEVRLSTAADAQLAIVRIMPFLAGVVSGDNVQMNQLRMGGSSISGASANSSFSAPSNSTYTLRFTRDGSNVISFFVGIGTAPLALAPSLVNSNNVPFTATVSGTLARVEFSIHTPSGPGSTAQWDAYVDYLESL
jgi:hypothetical protein